LISIRLGVVERLLAEAVAREVQFAAPRVPDRVVEHPVEPLDAPRPLLLVEVDDRLGVGVRAVDVALGLELGAQVGVVVDLAAEGEPDGAVLVRHRLVPGRSEVDDREAAVAEADARRGPGAAVVRPAVDELLAHGGDDVLARGEVVTCRQDSTDPAHLDPHRHACDRC
jgi:hypothetical protein